jgi:hypothetical protein
VVAVSRPRLGLVAAVLGGTAHPPSLTVRAPDVQAAVTILGRWRQRLGEPPPVLDLHDADLQGVSLRDAQLQAADLHNAQLQGANLQNAHLQGALLWGAQLRHAVLLETHLQGAFLWGAKLQDADLLEFAELRDGESGHALA